MVAEQLPFKPHSNKDLDLIRMIIKGNYTIPNSISTNMKNLIKGLLEVKEDKRLRIKDLFNQELLQGQKITKESLIQGLNIFITKYPIDEIVLNVCKNIFGIDESNIIKQLQNNKFSPITSLFKQIVKKLSNKGIPTINDLYSEKFKSYISDTNNYLKEGQQINNIQIYLQKEEEIKKNSQDMAAILLNNQNEISKGLEDLKRQFEEAKKGGKTVKRNRSFGNHDKKYIRRRTFQLDNNKDIIRNINRLNQVANNISNNDNELSRKLNSNAISVKRNTVCFPNENNFGINKYIKFGDNINKNTGKDNKHKNDNDHQRENKFKRDSNKIIEEVKEEYEKENKKENEKKKQKEQK